MTGIIHIVMARKPLEGSTFSNCLKYGTGAINVDGCRVGTSEDLQGRWPANIIHDGSADVMKQFPKTGIGATGIAVFKVRDGKKNVFGGNSFCLFDSHTKDTGSMEYCDTGSAGRYFFEVNEFKVGKKEK